MSFVLSAATDKGVSKGINQDAYTLKVANTSYGEIALAVMCDGMGGFLSGELASASVIRQFSNWFENELPLMNLQSIDEQTLAGRWREMLLSANSTIGEYGNQQGIKLGTTVTAILFFNNVYCCINVGDSRAYKINSNDYIQLTKDHTFVQREVDRGAITPEEARNHPKRNVITQCIGCCVNLEPDFYRGTYAKGDQFLLCSDGFRHELSESEIQNGVVSVYNSTQDVIKSELESLINLCISRGENDNITAITVFIK